MHRSVLCWCNDSRVRPRSRTAGVGFRDVLSGKGVSEGAAKGGNRKGDRRKGKGDWILEYHYGRSERVGLDW